MLIHLIFLIDNFPHHVEKATNIDTIQLLIKNLHLNKTYSHLRDVNGFLVPTNLFN